jgi:hypothetical protein
MNERRERPANLRSLITRIENLARDRDRPVRRIQRAIANTIVGQLLPPGVVKGGTAMKVRVGERSSRFTPDLDAARSSSLSLEEYLAQLDERLGTGWQGFTGTLRALPAPRPADVPDDYVMQPFEIRLSFEGRHWLTVPFELGRDEVGSTDQAEVVLAADILELFAAIGLPAPAPIPVLALEHQVAQKLHACTAINARTGRNDRAHDLVDLQLLDQEETIDLAAVDAIGRRLFAARRSHPWPPLVRSYDGWQSLYAAAAEGLAVLATVESAVAWANDLIARAEQAGHRSG